MYSGQQTLQRILVVLAVVCIPWMLLGVPIHEIISRKKKPVPRVTRQVSNQLQSDENLSIISRAGKFLQQN